MLGLLLAVSVISGAELFWRSQGYQTNVTDSLGLWAYHRSQLGESEREVACLGTSRTVCGFATAEFYRRFPEYNLRVLAVSGRKPAAALLDLAADPTFRGTVLCDATWSDFRTANRDSQQEYVDYCRSSYGLAAELETEVALWLQQRLVVLNPEVRLDQLIRSLVKWKGLPSTGFHVKLADRTRLTDYYGNLRRVNQKREKDEAMFRRKAARRSGPPRAVSTAWLNEVRFFREPVQRIQARGGKVVFIRYPTSGERLAYTDRFYPRELYWDHIGRLTTAETIYYSDYPELDPGDLPDTSHLDRRQSPQFTNALLDLLQERGILPSNEPRTPPRQDSPDYAPPPGRIAAGEPGSQTH